MKLFLRFYCSLSFFFFSDASTTKIYTLSLHDALPILDLLAGIDLLLVNLLRPREVERRLRARGGDRKSTRLNSSHSQISYAVFCLKKKTYDQAIGKQLHIRVARD